jgi:O-antigen ligase
VIKLLEDIRRQSASYSLYVATASLPFSVTLCHLALLIFIASWLSEGGWMQKVNSIGENYSLLWLLIFGAIFIASCLYSDNTAGGYFAMEKKTFFFLLPVAVFTSTATFSKEFVRNLCLIFCVSCTVALLYCFAFAFWQTRLFQSGQIGAESINYFNSSTLWNGEQHERWMFFSYISLAGALTIHPTYLAMYAAFCIMFLVNSFRKNMLSMQLRVVYCVVVLFLSIGVIFLAARVVLAAMCLFYLFIVAKDFIGTRVTLKRVVVPIILLLVLLGGIVVNPVTRYRQVEEIIENGLSVTSNTNYSNSTGIRASLWWLSAKTFSDSNIIFGTGAGDVEQSIQRKAQQEKITNVLNSYNPHSQYFFILLSCGVLGLIAFVAYISTGVWQAWQNKDAVFFGFLLLFCAVCLTESALELQKGIAFFSIFFSTLVKLNLSIARHPARTQVASVEQ